MSGFLLLTKASHLLSKKIESIVKITPEIVDKTLYIYLQMKEAETELPSQLDKYQSLISRFYCNKLNSSVDCRVYLTNLKSHSNQPMQSLKEKTIHYIFSDIHDSSEDISREILKSATISPNSKFYKIESDENPDMSSNIGESAPRFDYTVLGGTFDRLHSGHKVLLSEAVMLTGKRLTVGVTDDSMLGGKMLKELLQPLAQRMQMVKEFLNDIDCNIEYNVVPISDPFGPSITDPNLQCIIVSEETLRGGQKVNEERLKREMSELQIHSVQLVQSDSSEEKMSSTEKRKSELGKIIKFPTKKVGKSTRPYVIGLTGGIASGKSSIAQRLKLLGASVIDCDKLGHVSYQKGTSTFHSIVKHFGSGIINPTTGEIDRKKLGSMVFSDKSCLTELNKIVWPEIANLVKMEIESLQSSKEGEASSEIVVLDAAVLLEAGWDQLVDQIWTCIIPEKEAIRRIVDRNKLSEAEAGQRIKEQLSNEDRVSHSNLLFCSLWDPSETQKQVENAWAELNSYLSWARRS